MVSSQLSNICGSSFSSIFYFPFSCGCATLHFSGLFYASQKRGFITNRIMDTLLETGLKTYKLSELRDGKFKGLRDRPSIFNIVGPCGENVQNRGDAAVIKFPVGALPPAIGSSSSCMLVRAFSKDVSNQSLSVTTGHSKKYKALLVDAGGTLIQPAKPIEETYAAYGMKYGVNLSTKDIKEGFKRAFAEPWSEHLRYVGDGKLFWRYAVAQATGCKDEHFFEELYQHYAKAAAWKLPTGALSSLHRLRNFGVKLGVISNFDSRLRPLLQELNVSEVFHSIIVSCEVGYEKPAPEIFKAALRELDVEANETVLLGDDPIADKEGARSVGIDAWLWKKDVTTFEEVANKVLQGT